jgi:hypothetical protein
MALSCVRSRTQMIWPQWYGIDRAFTCVTFAALQRDQQTAARLAGPAELERHQGAVHITAFRCPHSLPSCHLHVQELRSGDPHRILIRPDPDHSVHVQKAMDVFGAGGMLDEAQFILFARDLVKSGPGAYPEATQHAT